MKRHTITRVLKPKTGIKIEPKEGSKRARYDCKKPIEDHRTYRISSLREMINIQKKNITDIEKEIAISGFSVELNRKLEREKRELKKLEDELELLTKNSE